jgi:GDPmannose 4,6-dehydratase
MTDVLELGNLDAKRDWGYAKEYVEGMYKMLQAPVADTYVLATNQTQTVRSFVEMAFKATGVDVEWKGKEEHEKGYNIATGKEVVSINPKFYRPAEVDLLLGDSTKARNELEWKPETSFEQLVEKMVTNDLKQIGL